MRIVEATNHPDTTLGASIAALTLNQIILRSLVTKGLLSEEDARNELRRALATHAKIHLPANQVAAQILSELLADYSNG